VKTIRQLGFGLLVLGMLVVAVVGVQVVPSLVAPRPTPDPATLPPPTLSPSEEVGLVELAKAFDGAAAMAHVRELCADRYAGRRAGTDGGKQAAEYIAARFQEYGLQPAGSAGTYFQDLVIDALYLTATPELAFLGQDGAVAQAFRHHQDFREVVSEWSGSGIAIGEVVYLGAANPVDFAKIDIKGRIVLCHPASTDLVAERAATRGAVALLAITRDEHDVQSRGGYYPWRRGEAIPCLKISVRAADKILRAAGRSLDSATTVGEPFPTGLSVRVSVPLATESAAGRNVLGLIPGSHPASADEVLILGAHYDHLGRDPGGALYPGAIDNASGVAVLLEIARLWQEQGFRPRVSVLLAAWDAEEAGLLGSRYYVQHPRYPLDQTVAMIQLDSIGGGRGNVLAVTPNSDALQDALLESARRLGLRLGILSEEGGSDHVPFDEARVPAVMLIWADAWPLIHVPTDTPDIVQVESLRQAGAIASLTLMRLALGEEL